MFQESVDVLRELVIQHGTGLLEDGSCFYCNRDWNGDIDIHDADCPITRARNLLTEIDAMSKDKPLKFYEPDTEFREKLNAQSQWIYNLIMGKY